MQEYSPTNCSGPVSPVSSSSYLKYPGASIKKVSSAPSVSMPSGLSSSLPQSSSETSTITSLTWNVEGMKRNMYSLKTFTELASPDLVFLAEPQIFTSDLPHCMSPFRGEYSCELSTDERDDPVLAMSRSRATGGVMVMWKKSLDKFITVHHVSSSSFLPIVFSPPGSPVSIHIGLYLPTSGREADFIEAITQLMNTVEDIKEKYEDCLIFLRGDGNVNQNNLERALLFSNFLSNFSLTQINIGHKTYHHFLGGGSFDSNIDVILQSENAPFEETITSVYCKHDWPEIDSHHDVIISAVNIPTTDDVPPQDDLLTAPKLVQPRHKIVWSEEGIAKYEELAAGLLTDVRMKWLNPLSKTSLSVLLASTNDIFNTCAIATNKSIDLSIACPVKSEKKAKEIRLSEAELKKAHQKCKANPDNNNTDALKIARTNHRALVRASKVKKDNKQDEDLLSLLSSNPSPAFRRLKSAKSSASVQVPFIKVGGKKYSDEKVVDGLFESISKLKTLNLQQLEASPYHQDLLKDYENIKRLCNNKIPLPSLTLSESTNILKRIKPGVNDFFSITANHFIHAGDAGLIHFNLLLNTFILDVNNCSIEELNTVYALLLYKGHNKDRTLDTSYRTISTCPLLAKGLDMYVRDLSIEHWNSMQAATQYQGEGSSHELASLLITEAVQCSKFVKKQPIFLLFLDAKSAFDSVFIPYLVRNLYLSGMNEQAALYMDKRLTSRITVLDYDKQMAGPIHDEQGLEQGGVYSSDGYKIYNNELLNLVQASELGVNLHNVMVVSGVGLADDTVLLSNSLQKLNHILELCLSYCQKYNVELSPSKTKLVMISPDKKTVIPFNPITIAEEQINFVQQAEHVGVLRSTEGNMPNIVQRVAAFKKALGALVSCGLAKGRRTNPVLSLRILTIYGTPVLMSGLASLVLTNCEVASLDQQFKRTLQNIIKLSTNSPSSLVHFVSGSLPCTAILHMKQITLFGMVCRLRSDPLNVLAIQVLLTASSSSPSWFTQVRNLMLQYHLPHPLLLLDSPPSKEAFKDLVKSKVLDYWEQKLRSEAAFLPSLVYFHPEYMSLSSPHRLWTTAGRNSYEVAKARIQLLFLSSQYPCAKYTRHWSADNPSGICTFPSCKLLNIVESPEHILLQCPAYTTSREKLIVRCLRCREPKIHQLVSRFLLSNSATMMQFLLDCSAIPEVIKLGQSLGEDAYKDLFYLSRTWCFTIHKDRMKRLCRWNFF